MFANRNCRAWDGRNKRAGEFLRESDSKFLLEMMARTRVNVTSRIWECYHVDYEGEECQKGEGSSIERQWRRKRWES